VSGSRVVYTTNAGRICSRCGWPTRECRCSNKTAAAQDVPARPVAKLRVEKKGRSGKTVTVLFDLPRNDEFLQELCAQLKRLCGTGGAVVDDRIELQGDLRDRVRAYLIDKNFRMKG
jgi:translation initiation factor 1